MIVTEERSASPASIGPTAHLLRRRLELAYAWYQGMVERRSGTLEYLYLPQTDSFVREHSPIRDIASVWDVELLGDLLGRGEMNDVAGRSIERYVGYLTPYHGGLVLSSDRLGEPSSIAHNAFLTLALLHATAPRDVDRVAKLARAIIAQQRLDGSYRVYFDPGLPDSGEELYGGEAMLALMEAYMCSRDPSYLDSATRAASYYDTQFFRMGRVADEVLVFFANWQSQACRVLHDCTSHPAVKTQILAFLGDVHERIAAGGVYDDIERQPGAQSSVEVASAIEGLADADAVLRKAACGEAERRRAWICAGVRYLLRLQCTDGGTERERGGFGFALGDRAQRIDITGHAVSAFMKILRSAIECPAPGR